MNLGIDFMIESLLPKDVIIFQNPGLNSTDPHMYVCVGRQNNRYQFLICSTQEHSIKKRVVIRGQAPDTVVQITPSIDCPVHRDSWIDCNNVFDFSHEELKSLVNNNFNRPTVRMPERHHQSIVNGICLSELVDQSFIQHLNSR
jgi:hypothetical protein